MAIDLVFGEKVIPAAEGVKTYEPLGSPENAYAPLAFEIVDEVLAPDKPNWTPERAAPLAEVMDPEIVKVAAGVGVAGVGVAGVGVAGVGVAVVGVLVPPPPPQAEIRATLNKSHAQSDVLEIMFS